MIYEWIKELYFSRPYFLGLFLLLPFLVWWQFRKQPVREAGLRVPATAVFRERGWKTRFRQLPFVMRLLAFSCLVLTLAKPQKRNDQQLTEGEGIDIVLCMDVSGSMGSHDILPSRMEAAKAVAEEFVRNRPVDRIGLVIFSGESFTQCPITTDRETLITQIKSLESRRYLTDGTVIGEGLATAVDRLSAAKGRSRVIILLTDGKEDPPETRLIDPLTALEIARAKEVKVYTIGMSAEPAATVAERPAGGRNPQADFLDEELLQKIAAETGGRYFRARDRDGLERIYSQIDKMEKTKAEVRSFRKYEDRYRPFVLAALFFLFLELLIRFTVFRKFP